jgi:RNA polymerase sigma-70 factor, ECF subfamily
MPDMPAARAAVSTGSCQVIVRERVSVPVSCMMQPYRIARHSTGAACKVSSPPAHQGIRATEEIVPTSIADEVRRFRDGDPTAAETLARHACRLALRTAAAILASREEAADVAQDVAVDVLRSLPKLRDPDAFDAWVHRITARHALRALRGRRTRRTAETPVALLAVGDEPLAPEGPERAALIDLRGALGAALAELPDRQRLALALRYVHDLPDEEIARALRCRVGTVHALLSRGRAALRSDHRLAEHAPTTPAGGRG